ncbi:MAG: hypothetical protein IJN91_00445 [Alphaproteobacteria bacterium]|nr:hypothetical protein [Alphaproteobacteria bacterium]
MKEYIDKVAEKFPDVLRKCRPAIAFLIKDGKDFAVNGYIVGDKYFINSDTFVINHKSDFHLINYLDSADTDID